MSGTGRSAAQEGPDRRAPEAGAGPPSEGAGGEAPEERAPVGTLFFLMIYLMVLAGMWATMYWLLLSR